MTTPKEKTKAVQAPIFDPFPKTNTMPSGWDLSGLIPETQPVSTSQVEDPVATIPKEPKR